MKAIGLLQNTIQFYDWGSTSAIPLLLNQKNPAAKPWAELWMGAHPKAPSWLSCAGQRQSLIDWIRQYPDDILGRRTSEKFRNQLPYLFKVLAAAKPLSIQAHPDRAQAKAGFKRENKHKIPLDSPMRNYKDDNHKPECICALSEFYALYGFRPISDIVGLMTAACPAGLSRQLHHLETRPDSQGLRNFYTALMTLEPARQKQVVAEAMQNLDEIDDPDAAVWMKKLSAAYPADIGILSPILLNLVRLEPGQALFLPAGELHAYLAGLGVELMANSDNVLRGGLTAKHIDVPELLRVVNFESRPVDFLKPAACAVNEKQFITPAEEFVLSLISLSAGNSYVSPADRSVEILFCFDGQAVMQEMGATERLSVKKGDSVLIPAAVKAYTINGTARFYKAAVPIQE